MRQSTKSGAAGKPKKPYPEFPLFAHSTGRWAKKIQGKVYYFGYWNKSEDGNWRAAVELHQQQREDLYAGRVPRTNANSLTTQKLCNDFLNHKRQFLRIGELSDRTFADYFSTCDRLIRLFGRNRAVDDLSVADFERLRVDIAKTRGVVALGNEIQRIRCVLKFAYEQGLIASPVRYGQSFQKPSRKTLRIARATKGKRLLDADELKKVIERAEQPMRAIVLLAINGGLGQSDVSALPLSAIDFATSWLSFPRVKTGIDRKIPLWPETVAAVKDAIARRPKPKDESDNELIFLTKYGQRWVKTNAKGTPADALGQEFAKLLRTLGLKREGIAFYAIRHTFQTVADDARDPVATSSIMGHVDTTMAGHYRERIDDARLRAVVDHVHTWLFGAPEGGAK